MHPARRLARERLEDCRLQTLERRWLGVERVGDVAGEAIPELFHEALAEGVPALPGLDAVRTHNALDLCSLAWLLAELGRRLDCPADLDEALRGARLLVDRGDEAGALSLLEPWVERGLRGSGRSAAPTQLRDAGLLAARVHRRAGRHERAGALWSRLSRRFPGDPRVHEALAKHLEHGIGDLEGALAATRASRMPDPQREGRLLRKLGDVGDSQSPSQSPSLSLLAPTPTPTPSPPTVDSSEVEAVAPAPASPGPSRPSVFRRRLPGL